MDSKIPKPSGLRKPATGTSGFFDFKIGKDKPAAIDLQTQKKPLSEFNRTFATAGPSKRRARSPDFGSKPIAMPKLRRSRSAMEFRGEPIKGGVKRFQTALETIPSKRLKTTGALQTSARPITIRTQEKKTAIMNSLKSTSASSVFTVAAKKNLLTKSSTNGAPSTSRTATVTSVKAPVQSKVIAKNIAKARPAPYDYKARHALLLEKFNALKSKSDEQQEHMNNLEEQNEQAELKEQDLNEKINAIEQELFNANEENEKLKDEILSLKTTSANLMTKNIALANSLTATSEELSEVKIKNEKLEETAREHVTLKVKSVKLEAGLSEATNKLLLSQNQLYQINIERMVLHNMILDLRGNIRVFARVRPPLTTEADKMLCGWSFIDETSLEVHNNELVQTGGRKQSKHDFAFDQVFNPNTSQEEIFEMVAPLIQSAMDGYNVCIFAYGQTGSGKTYTMEGANGQMGIIPRTVKLLFDSIKTASILGWTYTITASFLEIYNEVLYDLLSNEDKDIDIRMANAKSKTEIYVSNIELKEVTSATMLYELMRIANSNRATAATAGNERSSRSHAVTRLEIVGKHASRPESLIGFINLVDLAGSESPKTSQRMDETKSINRSLSELSNVILALVQKNEHIPYRNSKLTHLLMPSLGGNSKTLMFVNVSPFQENFVESVKSLRFAAQVNACKLAKAKRNRQLNVSNVV